MNAHKKRHTFQKSIFDPFIHMAHDRLFILWMIVIIGFGALYGLLSLIPGHGLQQISDMPFIQLMLNAIYFSFITGTSTGYGDITPSGFSKFAVSVQCVLSISLYAVFISKFISRKQDAVIEHVESLTMQLEVSSLREALYISRKDIDGAIDALKLSGSLQKREHDILTVGITQIAHTFDDIALLHGAAGSHISERDEKILVEAIERTTRRIITYTDLNDKVQGVQADTGATRAIESVAKALHRITTSWRLHASADTVSLLSEKVCPLERILKEALAL